MAGGNGTLVTESTYHSDKSIHLNGSLATTVFVIVGAIVLHNSVFLVTR